MVSVSFSCRRLVAVVTIVGVALLIAGCGSDQPALAPVKGKVTLDGQPLTGESIIFRPADGGRQSLAVLDEQGGYELIYMRDIKGASLGTHRVLIGTASDGSPEERVPAKYNRETMLEVNVQKGENDLDFKLESS